MYRVNVTHYGDREPWSPAGRYSTVAEAWGAVIQLFDQVNDGESTQMDQATVEVMRRGQGYGMAGTVTDKLDRKWSVEAESRPVIVVVHMDDDTDVFGPFDTDDAANEWITSVEDFLVNRHPTFVISTLSDPEVLTNAASDAIFSNLP